MNQQPSRVELPYRWYDGRSPSLKRWLRDEDLYLPDSNTGFEPAKGDIVGAEFYLMPNNSQINAFLGWVIFHNLQVIQLCPEECHSFWHLEYLAEPSRNNGVWLISPSKWKSTFDQRHMDNKEHYILEFYDDVVEVLCDTVIFGIGEFNISQVVDNDSRFSYAYLRKAFAQEKEGNTAEAMKYYNLYVRMGNDAPSIAYAEQRAKQLLQASSP